MKIKETIVGVDVGYESIKVVQSNHATSPPVFQSANFLAMKPINIMKNYKTDKAILIQAIQKALSEARPHKINSKLAVSGLPESRVFTKVIEMPAMEPEELAEAVPYEAGRHIPIPPDSSVLDWAQLGTGRGKTIDILIIGAPKMLVQIYTEVFQSVGLQLVALETKPIAAGRALTQPTEREPILILDIGAEATGISIFDQGNIKFTYTTPHGGNTLTKAIADYHKLSIADAEELKREYGLNQGSAGGKKVLQAINPILQNIIEEIANAMHFFQNHSDRPAKIRQIRITGGGAKTKNLESYITDATGIKAHIGNPLINFNPGTIKRFPQSDITRYTTAIGLSLRESF